MNAAAAWYAELARRFPRQARRMTTREMTRSILRAAALDDAARDRCMAGLAALSSGRVACPECGATGPHTSNEHHIFARVEYTCSACGVLFRATATATPPSCGRR